MRAQEIVTSIEEGYVFTILSSDKEVRITEEGLIDPVTPKEQNSEGG